MSCRLTGRLNVNAPAVNRTVSANCPGGSAPVSTETSNGSGVLPELWFSDSQAADLVALQPCAEPFALSAIATGAIGAPRALRTVTVFGLAWIGATVKRSTLPVLVD